MVIDGKTYSSDLIIYPDGRITDAWWRRSGHKLVLEDIERLIQSNPDTIIAGTGVNGYMVPDKNLSVLLGQKGISFLADKNENAVLHYNRLVGKQTVGACFHLTC
jgi:hypothetical protein